MTENLADAGMLKLYWREVLLCGNVVIVAAVLAGLTAHGSFSSRHDAPYPPAMIPIGPGMAMVRPGAVGTPGGMPTLTPPNAVLDEPADANVPADMVGGSGGVITSGPLMIGMPLTMDAVYGLSTSVGVWSVCQLHSGETISGLPVLGDDVAAVRTNERVLVLSAKHGLWQESQLNNAGLAGIEVGGDYVKLVDGQRVAVFSNASGQWSQLDFTQTTLPVLASEQSVR